MPPKRKRDDENDDDRVSRPPAGTRTFETGQAVKEGLASGSRQAFVAFYQQIHTYRSKLPLPISHPTITVIQHYLDVSPGCEEILNAWTEGDRTRNDRLVESAASLLGAIVTILSPLPFFRTSLITMVTKVLGKSEPYGDIINRSLQSERRDLIQATLSFVAGVVNLDPPSPGQTHGSSGKLALKMWSTMSDGGSIKSMGKMFGMRIRNHEGKPLNDGHDPLDRADIRHLALQTVLPLLAQPNVYSFARTLMPPIYSQLDQDPPVTVFRVLTAIWDAITLSSPGISRRISLALVNESSIEFLIKLLGRSDIDMTSGQKVGDIVKGFMEGVTTTPGRGICFADDGWYPREPDAKLKDDDEGDRGNREDKEKKKLHNRILANVIRRLGARVIDDDGKLGNLAVEIVRSCPELVAGYWAHSALAVDPKLSVRWMATMAFIGRIISLPPPDLSTFRLPAPRGSDAVMPFRPEPPAVSTIIESILPSPLHKNHLTKGLQHSDSLVRHMTAVTLARGLQKLQVVQQLLADIDAKITAEPSSSKESSWSRVRRELEFEARRRVPDVIVIITFAQQSAQLAPTETETEEEQALAAKSTMLTESALRLFGLFYKTLPSIATEAKFDVGRLLVSSSSAKAEKKEKQSIKSGSVADDTGSIASFGTAGTAGMGGGFGYSRGEVVGFDALSQVHVLALLRDIKEWDWARKAAASQYTYLYHILQLHLNTHLPFTQSLTSSLIQNMLHPTLLFEHDPSELSIWISAIPRAHSSVSGPLLTVQQIYLLSFLDDCFKRAQQFPYRYIEQLTTLVPGYFSWSDPNRVVSCVIMAVLEQFHAKMMGQHLSTDAAVVILGYFRRVLLGLMGKMDDKTFLDAVTGRLEETRVGAKEKGQGRPGVETLIEAIRRDVKAVFEIGSKADEVGVFTEAVDFPRLVDEQPWRETSIQSLLLHGNDENLETRTLALGHAALPAEAVRIARFLCHLLVGHPPTTPIIFKLLATCLAQTAGTSHNDVVKSIIFNSDVLKDYLVTERGNEYRELLHSIVSFLNVDSFRDTALSALITSRLVHMLKKPKKYGLAQTINMLGAWTKLLAPAEAIEATELIAKSLSKLGNAASSIQSTLSGIFIAAGNPSIPLAHLPTFVVPHQIYTPFVDLLSMPDILEYDLTVNITAECVKQLVDTSSTESIMLLTKLVEASPDAAKLAGEAIKSHSALWQDERYLGLAHSLMQSPQPSITGEGVDEGIAKLALASISTADFDLRETARRILVLHPNAATTTSLLSNVDLRTFTPALIDVALGFTRQGRADLEATVCHLVQVALQRVARVCSAEGDLDLEDLDLLINIVSLLKMKPDLQIAVELVEPVITSIIDERLDTPIAVGLATRLANAVTLKASFVRVHLSALLASSAINTLSETTSTAEARLPFIGLYSALFYASTYVSCQPNFIEPLLSLYRGTMSEPDRKVLDMFLTFESVRKVSVASILRSWSSSGLTGTERAFDAFTSLDAGKVNNTCALFPLRRQLGAPGDQQKKVDFNERIYDPVFILALYGGTMIEKGLSGLEWVEVMRCGGLGIIVCALSSRDRNMREYANWLLAKTFSAISETAFHERDQLLYTLRLIRHSIPSPEKSNSFPRLPPLIALFLSYVIRAQATPSHFLYSLTSRFLLQRPVLDTTDVPMLYSMLYASEEGWKNERTWIVRLVRDGMKSETDWKLLKRRHTWSLLATLYQGSMDIPFRRLILQALASFIRVPLANRSLVNRDCILVWLAYEWDDTYRRPNKAAEEEQESILRIYREIVETLSTLELQRRDRDDATKAENGDNETKPKLEPEAGHARPGWLLDVGSFVKNAAPKADVQRLQVLAEILSLVAPIHLLIAPFLAVATRLESLRQSTHKTHAQEVLFEASLYLSPTILDLELKGDAIQLAIQSLKRAVSRSNGELGEWVRKETRRSIFGKIAS